MLDFGNEVIQVTTRSDWQYITLPQQLCVPGSAAAIPRALWGSHTAEQPLLVKSMPDCVHGATAYARLNDDDRRGESAL